MWPLPAMLRAILITVLTCLLVVGCALEGGGQYAPVVFPNSPEFDNPFAGFFNGTVWPVGLYFEATDNTTLALFDSAKKGVPYWIGYAIGVILGASILLRIVHRAWNRIRR